MSNPARVRPLFVFAHGAGAGSRSEWMVGWAARLAELGTVVSFDYAYMEAGKKAPDRLPKLLARHREVVIEARSAHPDGSPVVLIGKSMGSRVGCHLSVEVDVDGLVCLGYPLCSLGKNKAVRDEVLIALRRPILFCQGERDPMGPLERFAEVRTRMSADSALHVVEGGNHSLRVGVRALKAQGVTQEDVDFAIFESVRDFVEGLCRA